MGILEKGSRGRTGTTEKGYCGRTGICSTLTPNPNPVQQNQETLIPAAEGRSRSWWIMEVVNTQVAQVLHTPVVPQVLKYYILQ